MPDQTSADEPVLLDYEGARKYLNISLSRMKGLKASGDVSYILTGSYGVRFHREDLDDWIARQRVPSRHKNRRAS